MLYAHKLTKEKKYFESARRAADVLLSAQSDAGGWPDQWLFPGGSTPSSGVRNGSISFNDGATNASFHWGWTRAISAASGSNSFLDLKEPAGHRAARSCKAKQEKTQKGTLA